LLDYNELKLLWRVPLGTYELSHCSTKKLSLTQAQLNGIFEFFAHAKKKHKEFLKVGPWRTEVLTVYGKDKSGGNEAKVSSELSVIAQEDKNTRLLYITVSKAGDCSITVSTPEADKLLSCTGKMSRIKKDEDYQPGQAHSSVLDTVASASAAAVSSAINPRGSGGAGSAAQASDDAHNTAASTELTQLLRHLLGRAEAAAAALGEASASSAPAAAEEERSTEASLHCRAAAAAGQAAPDRRPGGSRAAAHRITTPMRVRLN
jgi:hypothetical protein